MSGTITVKGIGSASAKPDQIIITMTLNSKDMQYSAAMEKAAAGIAALTGALEGVGFDNSALKTVNFNVGTEYDSERDQNGDYVRVFKGYNVAHDLKLEFDLDMKRLSGVLGAVSDCSADPELNIRFSIKEPAGIKEEMLRSAAENARRKAEVLCSASGVKLGELTDICYNWGEIDIHSPTMYSTPRDAEYRCLGASVDIEPEDIDVSDTVTFTWKID